jgi:hypothetical protein
VVKLRPCRCGETIFHVREDGYIVCHNGHIIPMIWTGHQILLGGFIMQFHPPMTPM